MKLKLIILIICIYLGVEDVVALKFPGPRVYVVTPSPRPLQIDERKPTPFYYHNWMRRMDTALNITSTTSTATPKVTSPDLIFAEFESNGNNQKSIRKLIEKERVAPKPYTSKTTTTTTSAPKVKTPDLIFAEFESNANNEKSLRKLIGKERVTSKPSTPKPIYVPDEETTKAPLVTYRDTSNLKPFVSTEKFTQPSSYMLNGLYNNAPAPVYLPSTTPSTTTTKASTTTTGPINLENIWHIIDNEKFNQQSGHWDESPIEPSDEHKATDIKPTYMDQDTESKQNEDDGNTEDNEDDVVIDDNFALPGIGTNPGNGAENESRAIRTGPNLRFPYINLKPFQMKRPQLNDLSNSKKSNMFNSLDNFYDLKQPVRGEVQDVVPTSQPIDRYNPAQPYLPKPEYDNKISKQNSPISPPKTTANLVPPPPPPPPRVTGDDFPSPSSYESFPPYAPSSFNFDSAPAPKPAPRPQPSPTLPSPPSQPTYGASASSIEPSINVYSSDTGDDAADDSPVMDLGYGYKPPSAPVAKFIPTAPPPPMSFKGYMYNKPTPSGDLAPPDSAPDFQGYQYKKPEASPINQMSDFQGYQYSKPEPSPPMDMADFQGYDYKKPDGPQFSDQKPPSPSYGAPTDHGDNDTPPENHDSDYPELIYNKHHDDDKGGDDMKGHDIGMMPPPPADMKPDFHGPPDDHGFPSDFPGDLKYHHDFDDHDHDHYHYHHTTTTTTTTEMPRVNRYSYYYLGKKLYYLPLYFSVYFIVYVGALIIKAVLRHKIVYPNSWRPNTTTSSFFSKRSVDSYLSNENLHELTGKVTHAIATAAEKYMDKKNKTK